MDLVGFSMKIIPSSENQKSFISSFPICKPFLSFSFLTGVAGTSSTMLNIRGERAYPPGFVAGLREKAFSLSPLSEDGRCRYFCRWPLSGLRNHSPASGLLKVLIMNGLAVGKRIQMFPKATLELAKNVKSLTCSLQVGGKNWAGESLAEL